MLVLSFAVCFIFCGSLVVGQNSCGIAGKPSGLILNGTESQRGAWPWLAAIHTVPSDEFICGGTLIASNMVITVSCKFIATFECKSV